MQKVITINLNGNAYQLDEDGYEALRAYLAEARRSSAGIPTRRRSSAISSNRSRRSASGFWDLARPW